MVLAYNMFMIHFVLIFVYGIELGSPFTFCMWVSSFPKTIYWKLSFPHWMMRWLPCQNHLAIFSRIIIGSLPFVGVSVYFFMPIPHCFDDCSFLVSFKIKKCESSSFVLSLKIVLVFWVPWYFMWILGWVFLFLQKKKKIIGIFIGITLNL